MIEYKCRNLVFSSSATIYKQKYNFLFDEKSKLGPINSLRQYNTYLRKLLEDIFKSKE